MSLFKHFQPISNFPTERILIFFFLFGLLVACRSNHIITDDEKEQDTMLKNKVKSITEFTTPMRGSTEEKEYVSKVTTYDENGLRKEMIRYSPEGSIESTSKYEYDKKDNPIVTYTVNADGTSSKETRSYDKNNNRIDWFHFLKDGSFKVMNKASYDENGRMIELDWYWPSGLKGKCFYIFDGEKLKEQLEKSPEGDLICKWEYKQDADNNIIEEIQYSSDGKTVMNKKSYVYDKNKQLIKKSFILDDSVQNSQSYEYNNTGLLIARSDLSPSGGLYAKYRYEFVFY